MTTIERITGLIDSTGEPAVAAMYWDDAESNYRYRILWRSGRKAEGISTTAEPWNAVYDILGIGGGHE